MLTSILAITRTYIGGFTRSPRRVPLQEAASDLRMLLLLYRRRLGHGRLPGDAGPARAGAWSFGFAAAPAPGRWR